MSADPDTHEAMHGDVTALLEAWQDRGTSPSACWVMLLASACAIAKALGLTPAQVCDVLRGCWEAAETSAAVDAAGGTSKKGAA
jgi:hypothetical protein